MPVLSGVWSCCCTALDLLVAEDTDIDKLSRMLQVLHSMGDQGLVRCDRQWRYCKALVARVAQGWAR